MPPLVNLDGFIVEGRKKNLPCIAASTYKHCLLEQKPMDSSESKRFLGRFVSAISLHPNVLHRDDAVDESSRWQSPLLFVERSQGRLEIPVRGTRETQIGILESHSGAP